MKIKKFKDIFDRASDNTLTSKTYIYMIMDLVIDIIYALNVIVIN